MAEYDIDIPGKGSFTVSADTDEQAQAAINDLLGQNSGPQWSDLPHNAMEGLKEAPQTIAGIAAMGKAGMDLTDPIALAKSGLSALTGTPAGETDTGKALNMVKEGVGHTVDTIKGLPGQISEFAKHPLQSTKEHIIEHPISSAVDAASLILPGLKATGAAETGAKYAEKFAADQMGHLHGGTGAQLNQLGRPEFNRVMRRSFELGDASPTLGSIGREQGILERNAQLGSDIGDIRAMGDEAGPAMSGKDMANAIREKLMGSDYAPDGKYFDQRPQLEKILNSIEATQNPSISGYSQRATELHARAAGNKLSLPQDAAETHVGNELARINDEQLNKRLPPEIQEHYQTLKDEFQTSSPLMPMERAGEKREFRAKTPDTAFGMVKHIAHNAVGGPKLWANVGYGAESALKGIARSGGSYGIGGLTTHLINTLSTDPQSLGKYAAPLLKAAQEGGSQGLAATHFILASQHPEYNDLVNPQQ